MNIYLDTIGCRLNQSEIETIGEQFRIAGHILVATPGEADLVIVNTCTVTSKAAANTRKKIRGAAKNGTTAVIATGCWATMEPEAASSLPGVIQVVPNDRKDWLATDYLGVPLDTFDLEPIARQPLPGIHMRTRAFIKAQDGCDNHCTFCITRVARGPGKSLNIDEIIGAIHRAEAGGVQEVVLTGVHLASWGKDFLPSSTLHEMVKAILHHTDIPRIRCSSLEPWDLDEPFINLWENPRLCKHFHIPLQSGSDDVLKRMGRKMTASCYAHLLDTIRQHVPDAAITTDIIVGFPGESDRQFQESLKFVERMRFASGHVFAFSQRKGTPAANFSDMIAHVTKKQRSKLMRALFMADARSFRQAYLGQTVDVLWESIDKTDQSCWEMQGLSGNYLRVYTTSDKPLWNQITPTRITAVTEQGLEGSIL